MLGAMRSVGSSARAVQGRAVASSRPPSRRVRFMARLVVFVGMAADWPSIAHNSNAFLSAYRCKVRMNDLRQLRHFVALAEHGHFARAAEAVHLSQPALSRSIQALESQLGCTLVNRHSRGISITAHGQLVLEHARRLLAGSRAFGNAVSQ